MTRAEQRRARAEQKAKRRIPTGSVKKAKRELTEHERSELFRRHQRREELNAIEAARQERIKNVNKWAAEERAKVQAKYA